MRAAAIRASLPAAAAPAAATSRRARVAGLGASWIGARGGALTAALVALLAGALAGALVACGPDDSRPRATSHAPGAASLDAEAPPAELGREAFVGSARCAGCHPGEAAAWRGSHHDLAMQVADESTVL